MSAEPLSIEEEDELRGLWLSRLMFGWMIPHDGLREQFIETRSFKQFLADHTPATPPRPLTPEEEQNDG